MRSNSKNPFMFKDVVVKHSVTADLPFGELSRYTVAWDSPSADATGSMPLGGGNVGLNVWVEGDDLLFYIGNADSRVEDQRLVKLGRVRLTIEPAPFRKNFRQELDLAESCIRISGDTQGGSKVSLRLWVDAFQSVVHVEMDSATPVTAHVAYESWRFHATHVDNGLEWCWRLNPDQDSRKARISEQKLEAIADKVPDPLKDLTLGGRIVCEGLVADGTAEGNYMRTPFKAWIARTQKPVTSLDLRVILRVAQDASQEAWGDKLNALARSTSKSAGPDRKKTLAWWREFWERSWIVINPGAGPDDEGWQVGRNYNLFRYMLACNRTGKTPTLFNGGIFTFDNPLADGDAFGAGGHSPDGRAWWGCMFMAQNQRLVYWPMLKSGDFDMLDVGLDFYRDLAPLQEARAKHFFGVEGTPFNESLDLLGLIAAGGSTDGHNGLDHLKYHYTSALDFAFMMVEECRYTGRYFEESLPVMMGVLKFYDQFYQKECRQRTGNPLDGRGRLVIYPGNSCELGIGCRNHSDAIAGLMAITDGLLRMPNARLSETDRKWLESFKGRIPAIPTDETGGEKYIKLAESWESLANPNEFPQIYTLFPFAVYGVGLPELELALNTWKHGAFNPAIQKEALCWKQGNIAVARLGLADEAKDYCFKKFLYPYKGDGSTVGYGNCAQFKARFPAFWVTYPFDAFPDMDHGGCAMVGLQDMLLQSPGGRPSQDGSGAVSRLLVLPAWPKDWDVCFKLHAPDNTTVECEYIRGRVEKLKAKPGSRQADIEVMNSPINLQGNS